MPGTILCYSVKNGICEVKKFSGNCPQDPIPFALLDELYWRYFVQFPRGERGFDPEFVHFPIYCNVGLYMHCPQEQISSSMIGICHML